MNRHEEVFEMLGAYALGALDEADAALVQAHVNECAVCRSELAGFAEVSARLTHLGSVQPPPQLRGRILSAVRQEASAREAPPRRNRWRLRPQWLLATALVALLLAQVWSLREMTSLRTALVQQEQIQTVLLSSDEDPVEMVSPDPDSAAHGYYRAEPELNMGLLNYYHLPSLAPDRSYHCWFEFADGSAVACGVLSLDEDGHGVLLVTVPEPWPDRIRVTVEEGQASAPTGSTVLAAELGSD
jgi:hypothetical protein